MKPRDLSAHTEYQPGRGVEEVAADLGLDPADLVKLSSNENPFGPSPAAVDAIRAHADGVHAYPTAIHTALTAAIADRWAVDAEQVWLANGGDGFLDYLARALLTPGDRVLVADPGFAYYGMSARYHHGEVATYPLTKADDFAQSAEAILEAYDGERIVYVTTPHNPTGSELPPPEIEALASATADDTLVLVDEAYAEFSSSASARPLLDDRDDVAILRTFSKAYGLAGLRLGYGLVPAAWAHAYSRVTTPFAASQIACRAGLAALDDDDHLAKSIETARWAREYIRTNLEAPTWASAGNFVLADVEDAPEVTRRAESEGVIVRDCTSFGLPACIRISCGTREATRRAIDVLNGVI